MQPTRWRRPLECQRRAKVTLTVSVGVFMASLDLFIVNIAFPDIQRTSPAASLSSLSWVLNAYAITFAALHGSGRPVGRPRPDESVVFCSASGCSALRRRPARSRPRSNSCCAPGSCRRRGRRSYSRPPWACCSRSTPPRSAAPPSGSGLRSVVLPRRRVRRSVACWSRRGGGRVSSSTSRSACRVDLRLPACVRPVDGEARPDASAARIFTVAIGLLALGSSKAPIWGWGSAGTLVCSGRPSWSRPFWRRCLRTRAARRAQRSPASRSSRSPASAPMLSSARSARCCSATSCS